MIVIGIDNILIQYHMRNASLPVGALISIERLLSFNFVILRMTDLARQYLSGLTGPLIWLSIPLITKIFRSS